MRRPQPPYGRDGSLEALAQVNLVAASQETAGVHTSGAEKSLSASEWL
jgi:hypothetical protein